MSGQSCSAILNPGTQLPVHAPRANQLSIRQSKHHKTLKPLGVCPVLSKKRTPILGRPLPLAPPISLATCAQKDDGGEQSAGSEAGSSSMHFGREQGCTRLRAMPSMLLSLPCCRILGPNWSNQARLSDDMLQTIIELPGTKGMFDLRDRADALSAWKLALQKG
eukprot:1159302-Pelagomonas_calceolata.AAC.6